MALLKYSQIRQDLLRFMSRHNENPLTTKFCDLKGAVLCGDFGDAKHIRLPPMCDKEPKDTLKPPFWAGSDLMLWLNK